MVPARWRASSPCGPLRFLTPAGATPGSAGPSSPARERGSDQVGEAVFVAFDLLDDLGAWCFVFQQLLEFAEQVVDLAAGGAGDLFGGLVDEFEHGADAAQQVVAG